MRTSIEFRISTAVLAAMIFIAPLGITSVHGRVVNVNDYDNAKKDAAKKAVVAAKLIKDCDELKAKAAAAQAAADDAKRIADLYRADADKEAAHAAETEKNSGGAGDNPDGRAADAADKAAADALDNAQNNPNDKKAQKDAREKEADAKAKKNAADAADAKAANFLGVRSPTTTARQWARYAEREARKAEREAAAAAVAAAAAQALVDAAEPCGRVAAARAAADAAIAKFERLLAEKIKRTGGSSETAKDTETVDGWKQRVHPPDPNAVNSRALSKPEAKYTTDWQPGDEVSFSFSGTVYGPSDDKQTPDDYSGNFVGIVDQQGNKTEIPSSKLIKYKVPELATSVIATLMKRDRTIISTAKIPVNPKGTKLPIQLPPKTTGNTVAYPVHQVGQPYTIYSPNGRFSGDANKIKLITTNKIDNATNVSNAVAASPRSALFDSHVNEPGSYKYTVSDDGRFEDSFDVSAVGIKLDTSRAYRVNQQGTLAVIVALPPQAEAQQKLFSENFHVTIEMETPNVLAFSNGQTVVDWPLQKGEVANNEARKEFSVRAGAPGAFRITARAKTPQCSNPSGTKLLPVQADVDINELIGLLRDPCDRLRLKLQVVRGLAAAAGARRDPFAASSLLSDELQLIRQLDECEKNKTKPGTKAVPPGTLFDPNPLLPSGFSKSFFGKAVVFQGLDGIEIDFPDGTRVVNNQGNEVVYDPKGKPIDTRTDGKDLPPTRPGGTPRDTWQPPLDDPEWLEYVDTVAKAAGEQVKFDEGIASMYRDAAKEARKNGDDEEARWLDAKAKEAEAAAEADRIRAAREQRRADAVRKRQKGK